MFNCTFSSATLNVRGLKNIVKRKALDLFCKGRRTRCILFQETHSSDSDVKFWFYQWGDQILFSPGTNKSAGVAICFNGFPGDIITYRADGEGHWLMVVLKVECHFLILTNVYGYRSVSQNKQMLDRITNTVSELKALHPTNLILMGGDWNMTPDEWKDRWPSKFFLNGRIDGHYNPIIREFININCLVDTWRVLNPEEKQYTWYKPNGTCKYKIDYWLAADAFGNFTFQASISKAPLTDHCITEMTLNPTSRKNSNKGYWKFNTTLLKNKDFCAKIK